MTQTFVLFHGAWHGGWAWNAVAAHLRADGHVVHQPTAPGLAPGDDRRGVGLSTVADALVAHVEDADLHDVVLVGHSWGGMVLSSVAERLRSRLARLVYYSAFVPLSGESLYDLVPPDYQGLFTQLAGASDDNSVAMPLEVWRGGFMQDAGAEAQQIAHALMLPHPFATFTDPVGGIDYATLDIPQSYVISPDDVALPPGEFAWSPRFPERLADPLVVETVASHESMFTAPAEIAAALVRATGD
ncbi:alpha/beta hydrolase [Solicola sp. PLA-1-18]|uniref:alpha/beta hydrolase n=1 Tax=Solicola sp. PLA-1-18 TaxID=3380532 RepID=UPI003B787862